MNLEKEIKKKPLEDPLYVCVACGMDKGTNTAEEELAKWFDGECELCRTERPVTHIKNFNYLKKLPSMVYQESCAFIEGSTL